MKFGSCIIPAHLPLLDQEKYISVHHYSCLHFLFEIQCNNVLHKYPSNVNFGIWGFITSIQKETNKQKKNMESKENISLNKEKENEARKDKIKLPSCASLEYSSCKNWSDLYHNVNRVGSSVMQRGLLKLLRWCKLKQIESKYSLLQIKMIRYLTKVSQINLILCMCCIYKTVGN